MPLTSPLPTRLAPHAFARPLSVACLVILSALLLYVAPLRAQTSLFEVGFPGIWTDMCLPWSFITGGAGPCGATPVTTGFVGPHNCITWGVPLPGSVPSAMCFLPNYRYINGDLPEWQAGIETKIGTLYIRNGTVYLGTDIGSAELSLNVDIDPSVLPNYVVSFPNPFVLMGVYNTPNIYNNPVKDADIYSFLWYNSPTTVKVLPMDGSYRIPEGQSGKLDVGGFIQVKRPTVARAGAGRATSVPDTIYVSISRLVADSNVVQLQLPLAELDIRPGSCKNPFNVKSKGIVTMALPGRVGFRADSVDLSRVFLIGPSGESIRPLRVKLDDVTSPRRPGDPPICDCGSSDSGPGPDRVADAVLQFGADQVIRALGAARDGLQSGPVLLSVFGYMKDSTFFQGSDCVNAPSVALLTAEEGDVAYVDGSSRVNAVRIDGGTLRFEMLAPGRVTMTSFDVMGRQLDRRDLGFLAVGGHGVAVSAMRDVRFYQLVVGDESVVVKVVAGKYGRGEDVTRRGGEAQPGIQGAGVPEVSH